MKVLVVMSFLATALAAPQYYNNYNRYVQQPLLPTPVPVTYQPYQYRDQYRPQPFVPIVSETNDISPDGTFSYSYVTGDGQQAQAQGYLKNAGYKDQEAEVIQGSFAYTSPDGTPISVSYVADENGFRAEGAHLPTPPPVPEAIQRALAFNAQAERNVPSVQYNNRGFKK